MVNMPKWLPAIFIVLGGIGIGSITGNNDLDRDYITTAIGIICWAILSGKKETPE